MLYEEAYGCDEWNSACVCAWSVNLNYLLYLLVQLTTSWVHHLSCWSQKRPIPPFLQQVGVSEFPHVNVDQ